MIAIINCHRAETQESYKFLDTSGISAISITKDLISKRKTKDEHLFRQYLEFYRKAHLVVKTFTIVRR